MYKNYLVNSITIDPNKSAYPPRYGNLKHLVGFLSSVSDRRNNLFSLEDLRGEINPIDCILQIDIEGDEWNIFKKINFEIENYPILIVEFHYIIDNILNTNEDDRYKKIINILQKINKFYIPVFTHCNNLSKSFNYKGKSMSNVLEVSYISKKLIEKEEIYFKKINFKKLIKKYPSPRTFKLYREAFIFND